MTLSLGGGNSSLFVNPYSNQFDSQLVNYGNTIVNRYYYYYPEQLTLFTTNYGFNYNDCD